MTSIIRLCPLSGGANSETPHCYLLEVDQFTFLLDLGWDSQFSTDIINEVKKHVHRIDAVLLSYPDHLHLGLLPYAVGKLGLSCPIYATVPVYKMGQMFLYDMYQARHSMEEFTLFSLDEVDKAFEMITQLKYNQTVLLKGKGEGLSITPVPAGHMIGGSIWKIVKDGEEDIVYAVDYNHKRERHLNGCDVEKIARPSLLITDAYNVNHNPDTRRTRDEKLMTNILQTLRNGGNVLVCVDTAGRILELAHMVDQLWQNKESGLLAYSLALCNNVSYNVIEFAKSQIEWMSEKLMRTFEGKRNNPFQFKHLKLCHSISEVSKVPSPKVVLASMPDMESGFSRELFIQWGANPKNSVIFTSRCAPGTLGHDLITNGTNRVIPLDVKKRVKLTGPELEEFKRRKEKEKHFRKLGKIEALMEEEDESSSDEELEVGKPAHGPKIIRHDIIMKISQEVSEAGPGQKGFFKSSKTRFPMFPCYESKIRWDDYGETIRLEDWAEFKPEEDKDESAKAVALSHAAAMPATAEENEAGEIPTKCVASKLNLNLKAQIQYLDFEGRSDGESVLKLVQQLKPRRVIIVRGSEDKVQTLIDISRGVMAKLTAASEQIGDNTVERVFSPQTGELVDATIESFIYQIRLPESLISQANFQMGKDNAFLAWIDGIVRRPQTEMMDVTHEEEDDEEMESDDKETEEEETGEKPKKQNKKLESIPILEPLPETDIEGHNFSFVNELKLSDFKMVLSKNNIPSEFQGGVLFCGGGLVALRRHDSGRVTIEGCICDEYYQVRDLLYEQYAIV